MSDLFNEVEVPLHGNDNVRKAACIQCLRELYSESFSTTIVQFIAHSDKTFATTGETE